jgi:hypothetical protein
MILKHSISIDIIYMMCVTKLAGGRADGRTGYPHLMLYTYSHRALTLLAQSFRMKSNIQGLMWFECCGISTDYSVVWRLFCAYKFVK